MDRQEKVSMKIFPALQVAQDIYYESQRQESQASTQKVPDDYINQQESGQKQKKDDLDIKKQESWFLK